MGLRRRRVVVAGSIAQRPGRAGHAWVYLQYLLGFRRLGWEVLFLDRLTAEMSGNREGNEGQATSLARNTGWLERVMSHVGLEGAFSLELPDGSRLGLDGAATERSVRQADLLLDVNGFLGDGELLSMTPLPVFLDIDPGFNQMWRELGLADVLVGHQAFVTLAQRMGQPDCTIPTCGVSWITTLPPVVLDYWPVAPPRPDGSFTTIATWRGPFAPVDYDGIRYGLRVHEFRRFMELPTLTGQPFELVLDIDAADEADIRALHENGWRLIDPDAVSGDLAGYQRYIEGSRAEFSVAKSMYVKTRSGWFSDRSACYLATGRPILIQDTGLERYDLSDGVFPYSSGEEAESGTQRLAGDYGRYSTAAINTALRDLASDVVLRKMTQSLTVA